MTLKRRSILSAVCLGILLASFAAPAQKRAQKRVLGAAKPMAPVTEINTERLKGLLKRESQRPLLVNFWATWCDPCRDEFPDLVKIDADYRGKGLDFIAISLDDLKDINTEVPKFLRVMKAQMPIYLLNVPDPEVPIKAVDAQWSGALPATFLYDAKGNLAYRHFGRIVPEQLRTEIEKQVGIKQ